MSYVPPNPNGQATSANSAPVVIASDQSAVPVSAAALPLPTGAATAAKQPALGTAGTASSDVLSVQGVAGGVPVPISGTVTATTSGDQTVVGKAASGTAVTGNPVLVAGSDGTNAQTLLTDASGYQRIKARPDNTTAATGTFTASGQSIQVSVTGEVSATLTLHGTFTGVGIAFEASPDGGSVWGAVTGAYQSLAGSTALPSLTYNSISMSAVAGYYSIVVPSGVTHIRVRCTALSSGTANVRLTPDSVARAFIPHAMHVDTELPTAGTLADAGGNPSTTGVSAYSLIYNGTTWDRQRSDGTTGGQGMGGTVASGATDAGNPVKIGAKYNLTIPTFTDGQRGDLQINNRGALLAQKVIQGIAGADGISNTVGYPQDGSGTARLPVTGLEAFNGATWDRLRATGTLGALNIGGDVASGAADSGNPLKVGAVARTTNPTAVADGQRVNLAADKLGKLIAVGSIREQKGRQVTTITASTAETTIVTAVAATFCDLYGLVLSNTSVTATEVTIRDATAGGTVSSFMVPAGETRGFMLPESAAWPQATVNNNWTATCGTSVSSLKVTALFIKNT